MDEETLANIYQAYSSGVMSPQEAADYEADVRAGAIQLPPGTTLGAPTAPAPAAEAAPVAPGQPAVGAMPEAQPPQLDPGILEAYRTGAMPESDRLQLERDIEAGMWQRPEGLAPAGAPSVGQEASRYLSAILEPITGSDRATETTQALPDWAEMPELNTFSAESFKSALGSMLTNPEETVQVIKSNFPGVNVRTDEKGNFILQSSINGQEYAIKPGIQMSDIPRTAFGMLAFTPAGRATTIPGAAAGAGATQAVVEAAQAATGGEFNPEQVPIAGAMGAGGQLLARGAQAGGQALGRAYERFRAAAPEAPPAPTPAAAPMAVDELATTARQAAGRGIGTGGARRVLAEQAAPDPKTIEAARRLGVDEYLQPDHVTTNQAYRELAQAVKSIPGSRARAAELQGLEQVAKRADNLIEELGGTQDLSLLDKTVKSRLSSIQSNLDDEAGKLYKQLGEAIDPKTPAPATNVLRWIENRADELGGAEYLDPVERGLLKKLSPDAAGNPPPYARIDDVRKNLTAARVKNTGVFKDADSGLIRKLEKELLKDQQAAAEKAGALDLFNTARTSVAVRKGVEDDMKALFGRELQGTLIGDLSGATKKLATGDVSKFVKLVQAVPEDMRQEVVASGLNSAFGKTMRNNQLSFTNFAKWYEGLLANKRAHAALMSNLPKEARKQLSDLYRVSDGIRKASRERITTGRLQAVREELRGADSLVGNLYDLAKRSSAGMAAEAITTPIGLPGSGVAAGIASALTRGKTDAMKATDDLISSPEFLEMAKRGTEEAAGRLAKTPAFKRLYQALGKPQELNNPAQWLLRALQAERQINEEGAE